jgi:hypothetical protein
VDEETCDAGMKIGEKVDGSCGEQTEPMVNQSEKRKSAVDRAEKDGEVSSDEESVMGQAEMIGAAEWRWDGRLDIEMEVMKRRSSRAMWDRSRVERQRTMRSRDEELMWKALGPAGFHRISFELKCW